MITEQHYFIMATALTGDPEQFFNFSGKAIKIKLSFFILSRLIRFSTVGMLLEEKTL
jgi:hypothetical protein